VQPVREGKGPCGLRRGEATPRQSPLDLMGLRSRCAFSLAACNCRCAIRSSICAFPTCKSAIRSSARARTLAASRLIDAVWRSIHACGSPKIAALVVNIAAMTPAVAVALPFKGKQTHSAGRAAYGCGTTSDPAYRGGALPWLLRILDLFGLNAL
jgi:hypothetical protein